MKWPPYPQYKPSGVGVAGGGARASGGRRSDVCSAERWRNTEDNSTYWDEANSMVSLQEMRGPAFSRRRITSRGTRLWSGATCMVRPSVALTSSLGNCRKYTSCVVAMRSSTCVDASIKITAQRDRSSRFSLFGFQASLRFDCCGVSSAQLSRSRSGGRVMASLPGTARQEQRHRRLPRP